MSDQLAQLAACSANFAFLAAVAPDLGGDGASAEAYLHTDPDAAAARSRRFAETLGRRLLQVPPEQKAMLGWSIQQLTAAQLVPQRVLDLMDRIRVIGNNPAHRQVSDNASALEAVEACFELGVWWFGRETGLALKQVFTPPAPSGPAMDELRAMVARVESQIGDLSRDRPRITIGPADPAPHRWQGGQKITCGPARILLHAPVDEQHADDRTWTFRQAAGQRIDGPDAAPVWVQGLHGDPSTAAAVRDGLRRQADLRRRRGGRSGLPRLVGEGTDGGVEIVAAERPTGPAWATVLGDGSPTLSPPLLGLALTVLADVAGTLAVLHEEGAAHLTLGGATVLIGRTGRRGRLRDLGLAGFAQALRPASQYRAPEQAAIGRARIGPPADVFQLSALLHHTATGVNPAGGRSIPLTAVLPAFPAAAAQLLTAALDPDPARRPAMSDLAPALRRAAAEVTVVVGA